MWEVISNIYENYLLYSWYTDWQGEECIGLQYYKVNYDKYDNNCTLPNMRSFNRPTEQISK